MAKRRAQKKRLTTKLLRIKYVAMPVYFMRNCFIVRPMEKFLTEIKEKSCFPSNRCPSKNLRHATRQHAKLRLYVA